MTTATNTATAATWHQANYRYLHGELERLRLLLRRRVLWLRRQWVREAEASYQGYAISEAQADQLLNGEDRQAEASFYQHDPEAQRLNRALGDLEQKLRTQLDGLRTAGTLPPLDALVRLFDLTPFERNVLLLGLAPALDTTFERLYGYVQDDATRHYATPELALALLVSREEELPAAWHSFQAHAPLRHFCLLSTSEPGKLASLPLRLPERVVTYLQGFNRLDEQVGGLLQPVSAAPLSLAQAEVVGSLARWAASQLSQGSQPRLNLVGPTAAGKSVVAQALCDRIRLGLYTLDVRKLAASGPEWQRLLEREAALLQLALYINAAELDDMADAAARRLVEELLGRLKVFLLIGSDEGWRTDWPLLSVAVPKPTSEDQCRLWQEALAPVSNTVSGEVEPIVQQFDFGPSMISYTVSQAVGRARLRAPEEVVVTAEDLWHACREQASGGMDGLAQRILPCHTWDDIVVPDDIYRQLQEIASQVATRHCVYEVWGFGEKLNRGRGISVLFAGPSGTGKTMAAEILAGHLRLDLYRIDLSSIVSKYIGETEKNLRRVFDAAERSGAILFFDEADALFGKRTEVKDSHDRYANIEIDYLLQRMEEYRGLAILATNMKSHLDQAFLRRLRFVVDFPFPDTELRRRIWQKSFSPGAPIEGIRYDLLARLEVSGGNIRNIALNAAFLAAGQGVAISMDHLMCAAGREYAKEERLVTQAEFGAYYETIKR